MVHALTEAHRVLKPDGILVDLRPAAAHRRVGLERGGRFHPVGVMREAFDDDHAANAAVAHILRQGLFKAGRRTQFECKRVLDSLDEFRDWLGEFVQLSDLPSHDWLAERVARALVASRSKTKIVVTGPLVMRVLRKQASGG